MMRVGVFACVAGVACGPSLMWSGHTDDRAHRIEIVEHDGRAYVELDGRPR
jgi:hypothetical protein